MWLAQIFKIHSGLFPALEKLFWFKLSIAFSSFAVTDADLSIQQFLLQQYYALELMFNLGTHLLMNAIFSREIS